MDPLTAGELVEKLSKVPRDWPITSQVHGEHRLFDYNNVTEVRVGELEVGDTLEFEPSVLLQTQEYDDYHLFSLEEADRRYIDGIKYAIGILQNHAPHYSLGPYTHVNLDDVIPKLNDEVDRMENILL